MKKVVHRLKMSIAATAIASSMVAIGGVVVVSSAIAATQTMVTSAMVNVRSGPGSNYAIVAVLDLGDKVTATGSPVAGQSSVGSTWTPVTVNGTKGYVASLYLKAVAGSADADTGSVAKGTATTNAPVNLRTAPSLDSTVLTTLDPGVTVQTTGVTSGGFSQVIVDGTKRWIFTAFLTAGGSGGTDTVTYGQIRTTDVLYLRAEGSLDGAILGTLPANSVVDVTGKTTAAYTQILYQGKTAWIATRYTTTMSATPLNVVSTSLTAAQSKLVNYVKSKVGSAYVWGAEGPNSFDCSGLTLAAYQTVGISLPHYSGSQATMGTAVSRDNLQPGDLIFWYSPVSHVSMYIGNGMMVHARNTQVGVVLQSVDSYISAGAYYQGARRFLK